MRLLKTNRAKWLVIGLAVVSVLACNVTQISPIPPIEVTRVVPVTQIIVPTIVEVTRIVQAPPIEVTRVVPVTQIIVPTIVEVTRIVQALPIEVTRVVPVTQVVLATQIVIVEAPPPVQTSTPVSSPTPVPPLDTDTLLLLHFDEPTGTTLFQDSSLFKHHACCHTTVCPSRAEQGLNFNGQDNYIMSSASIQGLSSFTLAGWFYARSYEHAGKHPLVFFAPGADCPRAALRIGGGYTEGPVLFIADTDNCAPQAVVSASGVPVLDQWHHIVAVFDSDTDRHAIYINGEKVAENEYPVGPIPDTTPGHPLYIGVNYSPRPYDQRWWDGYIDEIALYDRALSAAEVKTLYHSSNR